MKMRHKAITFRQMHHNPTALMLGHQKISDGLQLSTIMVAPARWKWSTEN